MNGFTFANFVWTKNPGSKTVSSASVPVSVVVTGWSANIQFGGTGTFTASSTNTISRVNYGLQYSVAGAGTMSNMSARISPGTLTHASSADNLTEMLGTTPGGVDLVASRVLLKNNLAETPVTSSNDFGFNGTVWVSDVLFIQNTTSIRQGLQTATLNSFDQTFTYLPPEELSGDSESLIPEPVSGVLIVSGLLAAVLGKRLARAQFRPAR